MFIIGYVSALRGEYWLAMLQWYKKKGMKLLFGILTAAANYYENIFNEKFSASNLISARSQCM